MVRFRTAALPSLGFSLLLACVLASAAEETTYAVGATLYTRGLYDDAAASFLAFVDSHPQDGLAPRALLLAAESLRRTGKTEKAYETYQRVHKDYPRSPQATLSRLRTAELEIINDKLEGQASTLASLKGLPPEAEALRTFLLAKVLVAAGRSEEASRIVQQAEGSGFAGASAYLVKGDIALDAGDTAAALASYQKASEFDKTRPAALLRLAELARRSGKTPDAIKYYAAVNPSVLQSDNEKAVWAAGYGLALLAAEDYRGAREKLASAARFAGQSEDAPAKSVSAVIAPAVCVSTLLSGDSDALDKTASQLPAGDPLASWLRAWSSYRSGDARTTVQICSAALKDPKTPPSTSADLRLLGAVSAAALPDWNALRSFLEKPIAAGPPSIQPFLEALLLNGEGAPADKLRPVLEKLLKASPTPPVAAWAEALLVIHSLESGDLDNSESRVAAFAAAYPGNPCVLPLREALLALAAKESPPAKIVQLAQAYISSSPSRSLLPAEELLAWGYYQSGDKQQASSVLLKAAELAPDNAVKARLLYQAGLALAEAGDLHAAENRIAAAQSLGFPLPPESAVWLALRLPPDKAAGLAQSLQPALKAPGTAGKSAMLASAQVNSATGRWDQLASDMDVFLASRPQDEVNSADAALARFFKAEAELQADRPGNAFTLVENALPALTGYYRSRALLLRGRTLIRLGKPDDALSDLLYVGMVVRPEDSRSAAVVSDALKESRTAAARLGKTALVREIDKALAQPVKKDE